MKRGSTGRPLSMALLLWASLISVCYGHASLIESVPVDGARFDRPPGVVELSFNEPVAALQAALLSPDGEVQKLSIHSSGATASIDLPDGIDAGGHAVTWRVVSDDGHPVAGTLSFTVGQGGAALADRDQASGGEPALVVALSLARAVMFIGLFLGVGSAAFRVVGGPLPRPSAAIALVLVSAGSIAAIAVVGLQGTDRAGAGIGELRDPATWFVGLSSNYATTSALALAAFLIAAIALLRPGSSLAAGGSVLGVLIAGIAISASGHAGAASPQWLTRAALVVHVATISFWVGALHPLLVLLAAHDDRTRTALMRFSRTIPYAVALLLGSGCVLAVVQLGAPGPAWLSPYGIILGSKLAVIGLVLAIACHNRYALTTPAAAGEARAIGRLRLGIMLEIALIVIVLGITAGWRFTTPPRALITPAPATMVLGGHLDALDAVLEVQGGPGGLLLNGKLTTPSGEPLAVRSVVGLLRPLDETLTPLETPFHEMGTGHWMATRRLPIADLSQWQVVLQVRIDDFDMLVVPLE